MPGGSSGAGSTRPISASLSSMLMSAPDGVRHAAGDVEEAAGPRDARGRRRDAGGVRHPGLSLGLRSGSDEDALLRDAHGSSSSSLILPMGGRILPIGV